MYLPLSSSVDKESILVFGRLFDTLRRVGFEISPIFKNEGASVYEHVLPVTLCPVRKPEIHLQL